MLLLSVTLYVKNNDLHFTFYDKIGLNMLNLEFVQYKKLAKIQFFMDGNTLISNDANKLKDW